MDGDGFEGSSSLTPSETTTEQTFLASIEGPASENATAYGRYKMAAGDEGGEADLDDAGRARSQSDYGRYQVEDDQEVETIQASQKPEPVMETPNDTEYVNLNPKATRDEIEMGQHLDKLAQSGELAGVTRVEGAPEIPNQRSADYRFVHEDGTKTSADLYQPQTDSVRNIASGVMRKSDQAETVVVEFGQGKTANFDVKQAQTIADAVHSTPDHNINRVIFVKDKQIILDSSWPQA